MFHQLKHELAAAVQNCLAERFQIDAARYPVNIQYPARPEFGDMALAFPFELAKVLRQAPARIAAQFRESFQPPACVQRVEVAGGGYINLFLNRGDLLRAVMDQWQADRRWLPFGTDPGKYIVEHTNINPNKAAHIGHLRNAVLGDSLVRLMRFNGKRVEVQNYIDNTGVQVADVVVGFMELEKLGLDQIREIGGRFDHYCWDLYARVTRYYELDERNQHRRLEVLRAIEEGHGDAAEIAAEVSTRIINCHLDTMERLDVIYDILPRESDILHLHFWDAAFALLRQTGSLTLETEGPNSGCWVMKYDKDGQEDTKIIVRSNGTVTYTGKDIAYQLWKLGKLGQDFFYEPFRVYPEGHAVWITSAEPPAESELVPPSFGSGDWVYNVIDARQAYTQNVVFEGVRRLGFAEAAEHSIHFFYEMVALSPRCAEELGFSLTEEERQRPHVEVSGRKGLGVKADDLLDRLEAKALAEVNGRNPEMPAETARLIARQIAVGALRYFMVKFTRNSLIVFDFEDALNFDGETGPYLQYSAVRARNILQKYQENYHVDRTQVVATWRDLLGQPLPALPDDVWELFTTLLKIRDVARLVLENGEISGFARFLYTLSQKFSNFYNRHRIIGEQDPAIRYIFLLLVDIYYEGMKTGLNVLGISVPERM